MASITRQKNGRWAIQFQELDGTGRGTLRPGKMTKRQAETFNRHLEDLLAAKRSGCPWGMEVSGWISDLPDTMAEKLARYDLIPPRVRATLGQFVTDYIDGRRDVKPATKRIWRQGERSLIEHFRADRRVDQVTRAEAEDYKQTLIGQGLADYTVRKRLQAARMFFNALVKRGLIRENPFNGVQVAAVVDETRNVFVPREDIERVLETCPDAEWRAIVALSRYAGLRCPSEILTLEWGGIDWGRERITVVSPKTEHHPGCGQRVVPLFRELRPYLEEAWDAAPAGAVYVIARYRVANANLRTQLHRIIRRAALVPWPKPFHGMRASFETELAEEYPVQVIAAWLGHSPKVALTNYLKVRPEHFERAVRGGEKGALQNAVPQEHEMSSNARQSRDAAPENAAIYAPVRYDATVHADRVGAEP